MFYLQGASTARCRWMSHSNTCSPHHPQFHQPRGMLNALCFQQFQYSLQYLLRSQISSFPPSKHSYKGNFLVLLYIKGISLPKSVNMQKSWTKGCPAPQTISELDETPVPTLLLHINPYSVIPESHPRQTDTRHVPQETIMTSYLPAGIRENFGGEEKHSIVQNPAKETQLALTPPKSNSSLSWEVFPRHRIQFVLLFHHHTDTWWRHCC